MKLVDLSELVGGRVRGFVYETCFYHVAASSMCWKFVCPASKKVI